MATGGRAVRLHRRASSTTRRRRPCTRSCCWSASRCWWSRWCSSGNRPSVVGGVAVVIGVAAACCGSSPPTSSRTELVGAAPYVITLLVLALASQRLRPPKADGVPYRKRRGRMTGVDWARCGAGRGRGGGSGLLPVLRAAGRGRRAGRRRPDRHRVQHRERLVRRRVCARSARWRPAAADRRRPAGRGGVPQSGAGELLMPCGRCRQIIFELGGPECWWTPRAGRCR